MEPEVVLTSITLTAALSDAAIAYFGIYKPFRSQKQRGYVKTFKEYWKKGLESFNEVLRYPWLD